MLLAKIFRFNTEDQYDSLIKWYRIVDRADYSKINIAINRTVNTISERQNPVDGF